MWGVSTTTEPQTLYVIRNRPDLGTFRIDPQRERIPGGVGLVAVAGGGVFMERGTCFGASAGDLVRADGVEIICDRKRLPVVTFRDAQGTPRFRECKTMAAAREMVARIDAGEMP